MMILQTKIFNSILEKRDIAERSMRRSQVGTSGRSEKIRTYNFQQDRVTDHRVGMSMFDVEGLLDGGEHLEEMILRLSEEEEKELLRRLVEDFEESRTKSWNQKKLRGRPDTSWRHWRGLPPCPLALVPLKCSSRNFLIGLPSSRRKCLDALALSKMKHTGLARCFSLMWNRVGVAESFLSWPPLGPSFWITPGALCGLGFHSLPDWQFGWLSGIFLCLLPLGPLLWFITWYKIYDSKKFCNCYLFE